MSSVYTGGQESVESKEFRLAAAKLAQSAAPEMLDVAISLILFDEMASD